MKLLVVTQAVDDTDPVLGFFVRWVAELATHFEQVSVICLKKGPHTLPENVRVYSLGKEQGSASKLAYATRFWRLVWQLRHNYDAVFVHMNPEYIVLAGWFWRLTRKRLVLWYTHKNVDLKLRLAVPFVHAVLTASKESFRLRTKKLHVAGHGIEVSQFTSVARERAGDTLRVLTAGRISHTKRLMEMLEAFDVLNARGIVFTFTVAGEPATKDDKAYAERLRAAVAQRPYKDAVHLLGPVSHNEIPKLLARADVFLNLSNTGSMDKAILEALVAGVPAVTSNEAFQAMLPAELFVPTVNADAVATALAQAPRVPLQTLIEKVRQDYALAGTIERISEALKKQN